MREDLQSVAVFCGSSSGDNPVFHTTAHRLGETLARRGKTIVYGGARVGLMGALADGALSQGGKVIGVLPTFLRPRELAHQQLTELILVDSMHERKTMMNDLCQAVIALPGGFGTLEELFETITWSQLGLHEKPIGLLNVNAYYTPLLTLIDNMVSSRFLKEVHRDMLLVSTDIEDLLDQMAHYTAPRVKKWIDKNQRT